MPTQLDGRGGARRGGNTHTLLTLRLLTYNTFSCDPSHTASQTEALLAVLETARADIITLQEVSRPFYRALQRWAAAAAAKGKKGEGGWTMTSLQQVWDVQGPEGEAPNGPNRKRGTREACVLLVREALLLGGGGGDGSNGGEVRIAKLDKAKNEGGKAAIGFRLFRNGIEVLRLVTSHFSALPENAPLRSRQYRSCLSFLSSASARRGTLKNGHGPSGPVPVCVFVGDTNASSPDELRVLGEPPLTLVDAITIAPPLLAPRGGRSAHDDDGHATCTSPPLPHSPRRKRRKREADGPSRSASEVATNQPTRCGPEFTEEEASFRHRPTFGHLYPYVHASARGRPRKVRRIDRVYVSSVGPSSARDNNESHDSPSPVVVQCTLYQHLGGEPLVGKEERDRLGRDGRRFASDHEAVLVQLELRIPAGAA